MRRVHVLTRHRLLNIAATLSLLLFVAACVLWARSYRVGDGFVWRPGAGRGYYSAYLSDGGCRFDRGYANFGQAFHWDHHVDRPPYPVETASGARFGIGSTAGPTGGRHIFVVSRVWALALLLAVLPGLRIAMWDRERRRWRAGLCRRCGYDLRATPDRCPECGWVPEAATSAT
jgi:hypothetical protein